MSKEHGKIEYVVTILNVAGSVEKHICHNLKELDKLVTVINNETYWSVQKIDKYTHYNFIYKKEIKQSPLHFNIENVTETDYIGDQKYSFPLKDKSLSNIKRVENKT